MTTRYDPRLLLPPEEEEIYPYRRVWRSLSIEVTALLGVTIVLYAVFLFVPIDVPRVLYQPIGVILAMLPFGLWLLFSRLGEQFVPEPRRRLMTVAVLSALVANAIGIPLVNEFFQVERWLPPASALTRILGYTFTLGITQEFLKYLVLRFAIWPDYLRTRLDGVAYGLAAAVGYATVANLYVALDTASPPNAAMMRMFDTTVLHYAGSILVGYGLAETRFGRPTPLLLPLLLALASTVVGIAVPVRAGLVNASLTLNISGTSPLFGLGVSVALVVGAGIVTAFLVQNVERQEREAAAGED